MDIKVDGKDYEIPELTAAQYRKVLEADEKRSSNEEATLLSTEGVDAALQFYFDLLNPHYPELTKKKLEKMPAHQLNAIYRAQIAMEILTPPLGSESEEKVEE